MVSAIVSPTWTGNASAGSTETVVVAIVSAATGATDGGVTADVAAGWFAAAITVVNPNTDDAATPVMMIRAPAATCGRRVRPVGAGRGRTVDAPAPGATPVEAAPSAVTDGDGHCSCATGACWARVTGTSIGA